MRRTVICLLASAATALAGVVLTSPAASAALPISGRLVDRTTQGAGTVKVAAGVVVRLRSINADGSPGPLVSEDTTNSAGNFSVTPVDESAKYYIRVVPSTDYQGGWVAMRSWDSSNNVEMSLASADPGFRYSPATSLGDVSTMPAYFAGRVINSRTLRPVANARITGRDANEGMGLEGSDYSGPQGYFRVNGLTCEDSCYLKVNGSAIGYETGFLTGHRIVANWGDAVASQPGPVGNVKLDRR
jgi:hypothetical protein